MPRSRVEERRRRLRLDLLEVPWDQGREIVRSEMDDLGMTLDILFVELRAAFASHLIQGGTSVPVVSRLLGHANISTTHRYAAVWEGDRRKAVDTLTLDLKTA